MVFGSRKSKAGAQKGSRKIRLPPGRVKGYKGIPRFFVSVFRFHYKDLPDQRIYQMRPPDHIPSLSGRPRDQARYGVVGF